MANSNTFPLLVDSMTIRFLKLLKDQSLAKLSLAIFCDCFAGALTLILVRDVSMHLYGSAEAFTALEFSFILLFVCIIQMFASITGSELASQTVRSLRSQLLDRTMRAPLQTIEKIGTSPIANALIEDVSFIGGALPQSIVLIKQYVFAFGVLAYLFFLAPLTAIAAISVLAMGLLVFGTFRKQAMKQAKLFQSTSSELTSALQDVIYGATELRILDKLRTLAWTRYNQLILRLQSHTFRLLIWFVASDTVVYFLLFATIGLLLFAPINQEAYTASVVGQFILALVFLVGPLRGIIVAGNELGRGAVAYAKIDEIMHQLVVRSEESDRIDSLSAGEVQIKFEDICFQYPKGRDNEALEIGPITFSAESGQVVFVTGGNGSGKTTFLKLLLSLYEPTSGEIFVNGKALSEEDISWYRAMFGVVMGNYCLFPSLAGSAYDTSIQCEQMLDKLKLNLVSGRDGSLLSRTQHMSAGERRRLALLLSLREDRQVYVFDELAAEQDPVNKEWIYNVIIPELREKGKLVFLVTHDISYDGIADSIIRFERGLPPSVLNNRDNAKIKIPSASLI